MKQVVTEAQFSEMRAVDLGGAAVGPVTAPREHSRAPEKKFSLLLAV